MDSSVASDPRFKLIAADLKVSWREVVGSAFLVWLACYERRSERLRSVEIDLAAELPWFAAALVRHGLATPIDDESVRIHGVKERIEFLKKQKSKGRRGGKKSGETRRLGLSSVEANASGVAQAYTPALAPALDLAPAPALTPALENKEKKTAVELPGVSVVTAHYLARYPKRERQTKSRTVRAKIQARLREGYSPEGLCTAIDGNASSAFHVEGGHTSLELIIRDAKHVDQFTELIRNPPRGKEPGWIAGTRAFLADMASQESGGLLKP